MSTLNIPTNQVRDFLEEIVDEDGIDRNTIEAIATRLGIELRGDVTHTGTLRFELRAEDRVHISEGLVQQHAQRLLSNLPAGVELASVQVERFGRA